MKIDKITLALLCLCVFCVTANLIYLKIDTTPPIWDPACHSLQGIKIFDIINSPALTFKNDLKADIVGCTRIYPPLVYLVLYPFYKIFGTTTDVAVATISIFFYPILILSVYKIAELASGKRHVGLLGAFLITMYPFIYSSSKQFLLDFPLTAVVSLSILTLIKADNFRNRVYSILFGAVLGIGLLTKEGYLIFITAPFLFSLTGAIRHMKKSTLINLMLSLTIGLGLSCLWYFREWPVVTRYAIGFLYSDRAQVFEGDPLWFEPEGIFYYINGLMMKQTSFIYFLILIFSLFFVFKHRTRTKSLLLIWFFAGLLILTFMNSKDSRYSMPLLPCVAIISAVGLNSLSAIGMRKIFIRMLIIYSISQFTLQSMNIYYDTVPSRIFMSGVINRYLKGHLSYGWQPYPKQDSYDINKIFKIIFEETEEKNKPREVYVTSSDELFNGYTLRYLAMQYGRNAYFSALIFYKAPIEKLEKADKGNFIIHVYPHPGLFYNKNKLIMYHLSENKDRYRLIFTEDIGNNAKGYVYKII